MKLLVKTVGKRTATRRLSPKEAVALQDAMARMYRGRGICEGGVHRFKTFEEADQWLRTQTVKKSLEHRQRQTSSASQRALKSTGSDTQ